MNNTFHINTVLPPKVDAFAGTVTTSHIDLSNYNHVKNQPRGRFFWLRN